MTIVMMMMIIIIWIESSVGYFYGLLSVGRGTQVYRHKLQCLRCLKAAASPCFIHSDSIKCKLNQTVFVIYIILKFSRYLENSTNNAIPTHRNILFNR